MGRVCQKHPGMFSRKKPRLVLVEDRVSCSAHHPDHSTCLCGPSPWIAKRPSQAPMSKLRGSLCPRRCLSHVHKAALIPEASEDMALLTGGPRAGPTQVSGPGAQEQAGHGSTWPRGPRGSGGTGTVVGEDDGTLVCRGSVETHHGQTVCCNRAVARAERAQDRG